MMTLVRMEDRTKPNQENCRTIVRTLTTIMEITIFTVKVQGEPLMITQMLMAIPRGSHWHLRHCLMELFILGSGLME